MARGIGRLPFHPQHIKPQISLRRFSSVVTYSKPLSFRFYSQQSRHDHRFIESISEAIATAGVRQRTPVFKPLVISFFAGIAVLGVYVVYQTTVNLQTVFVPLWPLPKSRPLDLSDGDVNVTKIQASAERVLLERLTLNAVVQDLFGLPLAVDKCTEFSVWVEEHKHGVWGIEFRPTFLTVTAKWSPILVRFGTRRFLISDIWEKVVLPMGLIPGGGTGKPSAFGNEDGPAIHEVPVTDNANNPVRKEYDVVLSGLVPMATSRPRSVKEGRVLVRSGRVIFKGLVDFEHHQTAKVLDCDLVMEVDDGEGGKRVVTKHLW
ncbi:hypothetical protein BABINDRAFT_158863 [Babjeviella inositovora NRRL Y-12698]|uniref:Uncharacterized protein n=1 Tax=Babjeviella inositovora NRRL Y-12698 TaxID=984486 RepID=A0A1E3QX18_9ASCO|nr:uncharacterized protein BABINDRAFT_158863 [Babjeviella inositovora NRRL Y-12698]ODQ82223.1 hypothetical protein BABINDRAFT_158863 [Babjeviella inositovora NRRL Y-12698]